MKRKIALLLVLSLALTLCACGSSAAPEESAAETAAQTIDATEAVETTAPTEALDIYADQEATVPALDFSALMAEFSEEHRQMSESETSFDGLSQYLVDSTDAEALLTEEEIQELLSPLASPVYISYEQALYDVDVLFRMFRSVYGAYYIVGEEFFANAESEILAWMEGLEKVSVVELGFNLARIFSYLPDAHTSVRSGYMEQPLRYKYFYTDLSFAKEGDDFYLYANDSKWYLDSFSDDRVRMEYTLTPSGEIVYSPVLFCLPQDMTQSTVTLKNTAGETAEVLMIWAPAQPLADEPYHQPDFKLLEENGIAYISVRSFFSEFKDGELAQFVASGKEVRDAELIIFDIRSNSGGQSMPCDDWVKKFCGQKPEYTNAYAQRHSRLYNAYLKQRGHFPTQGKVGTYTSQVTDGKQLENQIPIVVLVDDLCGSSGESMLNHLRNLDNVIIIGSNSAGYQLCGNQMEIWLPYSNIQFYFGTNINLFYTDENVDYKGYAPDVWCDPRTALDAALQMLLNYDLTDETTWQSLKNALGS